MKAIQAPKVGSGRHSLSDERATGLIPCINEVEMDSAVASDLLVWPNSQMGLDTILCCLRDYELTSLPWHA